MVGGIWMLKQQTDLQPMLRCYICIELVINTHKLQQVFMVMLLSEDATAELGQTGNRFLQLNRWR